ncbi:hypothetical protein COW06_00205 [Candidatus Gracilibacteria bacterium CG12_big_fil_rev_8_21_14_0_65_38_15]|nr:MAG: hypothetical protein COW68_00970 [Candidatus Gracilibacteria bacterium CG18_big_fil_WC_8_21_14_2_50_38_16]PIQ42245.1 MAG: hypothetical protein COW06_00205 [Candidatus Gracilibacteria bacterium CG12_big_fil_rev_8_21_14_0_65_38_15]PIZ01354.1 MAG: hypothetical protein COY60_03905 [Candidatus Gracilibacteria bacterium CG_4_10_14_0_8_um_filter_38_28]
MFGIISVIYIIYFSKILSFFIKEESIKEQDFDKKTKKIPIKNIIEFLKKGSYYTSFLFFYASLYGFVYSMNLIYNFSSFSQIFHYITLFLSLIITGIFFFFLQKKKEVIFLIFRSNCIIYSIIYSFFLLFFLWENTSPNIFFIINSLFPIVTLLSVLIFDSFFKYKVYTYILFLFYLFLIGFYYASVIFPTTTLWHSFLGIISLLIIVYTFIFPYKSYFRSFKQISQTIGIYSGYATALFISMSILFESLSLLLLSLLSISILFHYSVHNFFKNYVSYALFLLLFVFLYIKAFILLGTGSLISDILFIFILPYIFIGTSYLIRPKYPKDLYILHSIAISFSILASVYCFIQMNSVDILGISTILFFESILLFISYLRYKT